jgi:hypothetical protein
VGLSVGDIVGFEEGLGDAELLGVREQVEVELAETPEEVVGVDGFANDPAGEIAEESTEGPGVCEL